MTGYDSPGCLARALVGCAGTRVSVRVEFAALEKFRHSSHAILCALGEVFLFFATRLDTDNALYIRV